MATGRFSSWWSGERRPPALTADANPGAGLQGGNEDEVSSSDGDAISAPLEGDYPATTSNLVAQHFDPRAGQEAGLETSHRAPLRSGAARPVTGPAKDP